MLNRTLRTFWAALAALLLVFNIELGSPLSGGMLLVGHPLDHSETPSENTNQSAVQPTRSPQIETSTTSEPTNVKGDRTLQKDQPAQADPSVPYDPYDLDVIRQIDREIYGEVQGNNEK